MLSNASPQYFMRVNTLDDIGAIDKNKYDLDSRAIEEKWKAFLSKV